MFEIFVCLFVLKGEQETREGTCSEFPCLVEGTPFVLLGRDFQVRSAADFAASL